MAAPARCWPTPCQMCLLEGMVERSWQGIGFARDAVAELALAWEQAPDSERRALVLEYYLGSMSSHCAAVLGGGRAEHLGVAGTMIIGNILMPTVTCRNAPGRKASGIVLLQRLH